MKPVEGYVAHESTGRARLNFPSLRNKPDALSELMSRILKLPHVVCVDGRYTTGSIIIYHQAQKSTSIWQAAKSAGLIVIPNVEYDELKGPIKASITLSNISIATMFILGLYQVTRGSVLPPAFTLLWYAMELVRQNGWEEFDHGDMSDAD